MIDFGAMKIYNCLFCDIIAIIIKIDLKTVVIIKSMNSLCDQLIDESNGRGGKMLNERYDEPLRINYTTREEMLPDFTYDFPYTATKAYISSKKSMEWHWHSAVEMFYIESGSLEYNTPNGKVVLEEGCGGFVNSGVLHMTQVPENTKNCVQLIHIFDTTFISGHTGSRIDQKYIFPIVNLAGLEMIPLYMDNEKHSDILKSMRESFDILKEDEGVELRLKAALSDIWFKLLNLPEWEEAKTETKNSISEKVKLMMAYIHEHYGDKLTVTDIANATYISERECYRSFQSVVHMTPTEYIRKYRLQEACHMLLDTNETITVISQSCGFGSSSFFGKVFKEAMNMTPLEYRNNGKGKRNIPS